MSAKAIWMSETVIKELTLILNAVAGSKAYPDNMKNVAFGLGFGFQEVTDNPQFQVWKVGHLPHLEFTPIKSGPQ